MSVNIEAEVPVTRCPIEQIFTRPFIELLKLAPNNPVVRGLILAQTKKMPGPEISTFDRLKEWVETQCTRKIASSSVVSSESPEAFTIKVDFSETERGRASYSASSAGEAEFPLNEAEVIELVQEAIDEGHGMDEAVEKISNLIQEEAWEQCDPSMEAYGDYDYDDHERTETDNTQVEFSRSQINQRLREFLTDYHPELMEQLL